jgi:signal transduction histidine kinase
MTKGLPIELKALAAFLDGDDRPTALFAQGFEDATTWEVVYANRALLSHGDNLLREATAFIRQTHGPATSNQRNRRSSDWSKKDVGDGYLALTCNTIATPSPAVNEPSVKPEDDLSLPDGDPIRKLDWIKYPSDDLTKWQKFFLEHNWSNTPLGPLKDWTFELRSVVISAMADLVPRTIYWGPQNAFIYNEAFVPIFGLNHPDCLGQPVEKVWRPGMKEMIWSYVLIAYQGRTQKIDRLSLSLERNGSLEETYWDATFTPTIGQDGRAIGVQGVLLECTRAVRGERRRVTTTNLAKHISSAGTLTEVWSSFLNGLSCDVVDLPYAVFYSAEHDLSHFVSELTDSNAYTPENTTCTLEGTMGVLSPETIPQSFSLASEMPLDAATPLRSSFAAAWRERKTVMLSSEALPAYLSLSNPDRGYGQTVQQAIVMPITSITSRDLMGVLVVGICPRVPFDELYKMWLNILGDVLHKAAAFVSLPIEQRRAQKMSDDIRNALAQQLQLTALQAERSDAKFSRMANTSPIGMYVLSPEGVPLYVNDAYRRLVPALPDGSAVSFNKPSDWTNFIHPDDVCRFWASWEKVTVQKIPDVCEYRILKQWQSIDKATGEKLSGETWLLATSFPEVEPDGRVSVIMGWITDISKQKAAERLLSQRLEDALETKRQTEAFIDMVSHEMRNPLSSILLSADSIISSLQPTNPNASGQGHDVTGHVAKDLVDAAQTIILCANFQKKIVDDILTLSKLDASLLEIAPDKAQIPQLVEKALRMFDTEIIRADIRTRLVIEPTYDALEVDWVVLDPSRLLQVIINLLTNAIKFTSYSEVREITIYIGASYERPTGKHHGINFVPLRHAKNVPARTGEWGEGEDIYLQLAVTDTGSGLDDEQIQVLFKRFAQASPKTYKQYGGSGLGLFISRELCELQGGQIGVCSSADRTTFTFYVKAKRWIETDAEPLAALTRFASASSSPTMFNRRGSSMLVHTSDQEQPTRNGSHLDGMVEIRSLLPPQKAPKTDAELVDHLHVLVVEGELPIWTQREIAPLINH